MLLDDNVVTDRQAKAGAFSGRLGGKERIEHLFSDLGWYAGPVIPNTDFHTISKASCRGRKGWLIDIAIGLAFALCRYIKPFEIRLRSTRVMSWGNTSAQQLDQKIAPR